MIFGKNILDIDSITYIYQGNSLILSTLKGNMPLMIYLYMDTTCRELVVIEKTIQIGYFFKNITGLLIK